LHETQPLSWSIFEVCFGRTVDVSQIREHPSNMATVFSQQESRFSERESSGQEQANLDEEAVLEHTDRGNYQESDYKLPLERCNLNTVRICNFHLHNVVASKQPGITNEALAVMFTDAFHFQCDIIAGDGNMAAYRRPLIHGMHHDHVSSVTTEDYNKLPGIMMVVLMNTDSECPNFFCILPSLIGCCRIRKQKQKERKIEGKHGSTTEDRNPAGPQSLRLIHQHVIPQLVKEKAVSPDRDLADQLNRQDLLLPVDESMNDQLELESLWSFKIPKMLLTFWTQTRLIPISRAMLTSSGEL
ncbi:unnamed protein product, partial [Symbiodinium necroappetens]